jgi:hypothetical protein
MKLRFCREGGGDYGAYKDNDGETGSQLF